MCIRDRAIAVPFNNKELKIRTGSFRNINEPGAKETWTIEIEGLNGKEKATELLTSCLLYTSRCV